MYQRMTKRKETPETPEERFKRLATGRMRQVVHFLRLLGNCTGPGYKHTRAQAMQMLEGIDGEVAKVRAAYESHPGLFDFDEFDSSIRVVVDEVKARNDERPVGGIG